MRATSLSHAGWLACVSPALTDRERLRRTERVISFIRLGVVCFNVATYAWMAPASDRRTFANIVMVVGLLYAFVTVFYRPTPSASFTAAFATTIIDNVLIGIWIFATDGFASPYYPLFYAEAAASVGRFGPLVGNLSALGGAGIYLGVVLVDGARIIWYDMVVRLGYIFVISAFVSYVFSVARRSERETAQAERETAAYMELEKLRSTFVMNVTHELRTPLTAIRGAAATLSGRHELADEQRGVLVEMIDRQSKNLAGLIQDVIDVGLAHQGSLAPKMGWVDLCPLVAAQVETLERRTGRTLSLTLPHGSVEACCDGPKIAQALNKVLDNAVKFSAAPSPIEITLEHDDNEVVIVISDQGIGISAQDAASIFEPFTQVDASPTREAGGAGLGLSVVRNILDIHGGSISVESAPGRGSSFTLRFPKLVSVSDPASDGDYREPVRAKR